MMIINIIRIFIMLLIALPVTMIGAVTTALADVTFYGSNQSGDLFNINVSTQNVNYIGGVAGSTEIEYDVITGTLYSVAPAGISDLYTINTSTGDIIDAVSHTYGALNGLEFVGSTLYGTLIASAGTPTTLVTVNTSSGNLTTLGNTGFSPISGLAYDAGTGTMYGVTAGGDTADLVTIDLTTGSTTVIGSTGLERIGSIEFGDDGNLYGGMTGTASMYANYLVQINTSTGDVTPLFDTGYSITGITSATVVPEPISSVLFIVGSATLGFSRLRRRCMK